MFFISYLKEKILKFEIWVFGSKIVKSSLPQVKSSPNEETHPFIKEEHYIKAFDLLPEHTIQPLSRKSISGHPSEEQEGQGRKEEWRSSFSLSLSRSHVCFWAVFLGSIFWVGQISRFLNSSSEAEFWPKENQIEPSCNADWRLLIFPQHSTI